MKELQFPPSIRNNVDSREIARICITGNTLTFVILADIWQRPSAWGIVMADLARQVADALPDHVDRDLILSEIRSVFDAEWSHPTK